jgi:hypothetical protein
MRPILTKDMCADSFTEFYWLKKELQCFCRENGLSASGTKMEISARIEIFLRTGEVILPIRKSKGNRKPETQAVLTLDTIISENHRCSQNVRSFFKTVIPHFHFSTFIQHYFKNNIGKTYRDVVDAWYIEEERKKDPSYKKKIAPQFEYNQFIHDFFADPSNQRKSRDEAIEEWNNIKKLPGSNKYKPGR